MIVFISDFVTINKIYCFTQFIVLLYNNVSGSRLPSIHTPTYKLSKAEFGFMNYAPRLWNSLPKDVKQSGNVNMFKNKLKTHLFSRSHPV